MRLINYLLSFFTRVKAPLERYDVYRPQERYIYHYWNGSRLVAADPLELYKRVSEIGTELSINMKVAQSQSKASKEAHANMLGQIREVFDIDPPATAIDCTGTLSQVELIDLFDHFMLYAEGVKKKFEEISDLTDGNLAALRAFYGRKPRFVEFFGLWLNRKRAFYRRAGAVAYGAAVAFGSVNPGKEYYESITDGEAEANLLRAQTEALRRGNG